jgi:hypothetical protein
VIALLAATALAQFRGEDCTNQGTFPIAGTSGYENGLEALRVQAATYSASAFAERSLFPHAPKKNETGGIVLYELNQAYNVARVPIYHTSGSCEPELRFGTRPLDLTSSNFGLAFRYKRVSAFYAAGVVWGNLGEISNVTRIPMSIVIPAISSYGLAFSGITGSRQVVLGSTAWALDAMGGAAVDLELVELRAGYTGSQGLYFSASERTVGLFGNALVKPADGADVPQAEGGAKRIRWWGASDVIGRTSVWGRQLPFAESVAAVAQGEPVDLVTGHFEQTDIGKKVDLGFALAAEPEVALYEAHATWHTPGYHDAIVTETVPEQGWASVRAGVVRMPTQWYYGLEGGYYVQARADMVIPFPERPGSYANVAVMFNDSEMLALYPFAVNALAFRLSIRGDF